MHGIKQRQNTGLANYDSASSSCSKKAYSDFLVNCSFRRKHIWASSEQIAINNVCSVINPALSS